LTLAVPKNKLLKSDLIDLTPSLQDYIKQASDIRKGEHATVYVLQTAAVSNTP
jgi:flagella basal body P-ring formation protein FlgA